MSRPKSPDQTFTSDWNKSVAWAQTQGIPMSVITPVYQYDVGRLQTQGYGMSAAERNRTLLAAQNPNSVTPVPSDHPSPWSFLGNAVNDLRSIFTGLAPNHLIPNLFDTAESTIMHPSTWINPIEDVGKGILSGNLKDIRTGLTLAGKTGNILSLVPGVWDLSQVAQGGIQNLMEHPIASFLDVAPFAPAGKVLTMAAGEVRMANIAGKMGTSVDELYKMSVPKMGMKWALSRDLVKKDAEGNWVPRFPGAGRLTQTLTIPVKDPKSGLYTYQPASLGSAMRYWIEAHTGVSKTAAAVAAGAYDLGQYGTEADLFVMRPFQMAEQGLGADQLKQLKGLQDRTDPAAIGRTPAEIMRDTSIDPKVRTAYDKLQDVQGMYVSRGMASGELKSVTGPEYRNTVTGKMTRDTEFFGVAGEPSVVVESARALRKATMDAVEAAGPAHKLSKEATKLDEAADHLRGSMSSALDNARKTKLEGRISTPIVMKGEKVKESASLEVERQANLLLGPEGLVEKVLRGLDTVDSDGKPKEMDFDTLAAVSAEATKALSKDGYGMVAAERDPSLQALKANVQAIHRYAVARAARERDFLKEMTDGGSKSYRLALKRAVAAQRDFEREWWRNPPDRWRSVLYDKFIDEIIRDEKGAERIGVMSSRLKELDYTEKQIQAMRSDPRKIAEAIWHESRHAASNPNGLSILDHEDVMRIYRDATDEVNKLRDEGHEVSYLPVVTTLDVSEFDPGRYGVGIASKGAVRALSTTKRRVMDDFMPERHDLNAAVHMAAKEAIQRDITIEFAETHLAPHAMTAGEVMEWAMRSNPDVIALRDPALRNQADVIAASVARQLGLKRWDPTGHFGFSLPRWQGQAIYLPAGLADSVDKLLDKSQFPMEGAFDKATGLFRFSVLGLSPRYTAHIVFGGTFLLALRASPQVFLHPAHFLKGAMDMVKGGEMPTRIVQGATERGVEPVAYRSFDPVKQGLEGASTFGGHQMGNLLLQEEAAKAGIPWAKLSPVQWLKLAGEKNFQFTNFVTRLQRSVAYLDGYEKALKGKPYVDPETGVDMTAARAKELGIQHALKTMGDLKAMTPLERSIMTKVMPFYGWTRHILQYVLTYPSDHPYRAQFLSVLADQNTDSVGKAIDKRIQFLFFLGSPDKQGNVSAMDVRFLDPLRDVANYATLGGFIQALNPVFSAPLAMIDPQLIYGSTSLYPKVTYDQFYGIDTASSQGNALTAAEQFVPQITALDAALNLSGQYRQLGQKNPNAFYKTIFQALNIPFAQVQSINLKQLAAKGEVARYDVAKQAAVTAFQTGDFSGLAGYGNVPNPLNPDYEISVKNLQALYNAALQQYPGQAPVTTITPPQTPAGY